MSKYKLICLSFDGEMVTERPEFDTTAEAWEHANDMGSKWYFYPFHFVATASGKTIVESPDLVECFNGKRVETVRRMFAECSKLPEAENMNADDYAFLLMEKCMTESGE